MKKFSRIPFLISVFVVIFALAACGPAPAGADTNVAPNPQSVDVEFMGTVENISDGQWDISGQTVMVNAQTQVENGIALGTQVQVRATVQATGDVVANRIRAFIQTREQDVSQNSSLEFTGVVEAIAANIWDISGQTFSIDSQTEINGNILLGDMVKVEYLINSDGSYTAIQISPVEALQTGNTFQFQFQNTVGQQFELFGTVEAIGIDEWIVAGQTFAINAQTEITGTIVEGDFVKVHLFDDNGTLTAREIALSPAENQAQNAHFEFTGVVDSFENGMIVVGGQTFIVTAQTRIKGVLAVGDTVRVEATIASDGTLSAREITQLGGATFGSGGSSSSAGGASSSLNSGVSSSFSSSDDDHGGSSSTSTGEDDKDDDHSGSSSSSSSEDDDKSGSGGGSSSDND